MKIPQIKDKVTARAFALYIAYVENGGDEVIKVAKDYTDFIIGDAELPEVAEDPNMKVLDMWSEVKESSEKSERETSKWLKEIHPNLPLRANNHTEPNLKDIQNETH